MINALKSVALLEFFAFFQKTGADRLSGLDKHYFERMSDADRQEAWNFLEPEFTRSSDSITGLYLLDSVKAAALFKAEIDTPMPSAPYPALRRTLESNRLLMLKYINKVQPDPFYVDAMTAFANSEFDDVRGEFAQAVPISPVTRSVVDALKHMIFTEVEQIPLTMAVTKLMVIHGMDFDRHDPVYKSIFLALMSDKPDGKIGGMARLDRHHIPDYLD
jgi:hypothetical protein